MDVQSSRDSKPQGVGPFFRKVYYFQIRTVTSYIFVGRDLTKVYFFSGLLFTESTVSSWNRLSLVFETLYKVQVRLYRISYYNSVEG